MVALVNLYIFSFKLKKYSLIRSLFIALSLLGSYHALVFTRLVTPTDGIHQWEINFIKIQRYAYQKSLSLKIVIAGSSLTANIQASDISPQVINLGMSGGCSQTGAEAILMKPSKPAILLVEINETISRKLDDRMIDYIYNPILYSTRFYIPMLRQEYQPVSVFLPTLSSIKHRLMNRESVTNNLSNIRQIVNIDPILTDKLIAQQIEINKVPLTEKEKILLRKEIEFIKYQISQLSKYGVRIILFNIPVEQRVQNTVRAKQIEALTSELFPIGKFEWLPEPPPRHWTTYDGTHLVSADAKDYAAFLSNQLFSGNGAVSEPASSHLTVKPY